MNIYNYHALTGEYISTNRADESPLEPGKYLVPSYAMLEPPPQAGNKQIAVSDGQAWRFVDDYRGTIYYMPDGTQHVINGLGIKPPQDSTLIPPIQPPVALVCTKYQICQALSRLGLRQAVESAVDAGSQELQDAWHFAAELREDHPKIMEIATAIGKTPDDIKTIFALAVTLFP